MTAGRRRALRWTPALMLSVVSLAAGSAAHLSANGLMPGQWSLLALLVLGTLMSAPLLAGQLSTRRVVVLEMVGQTAVHTALTAVRLHQTNYRTDEGPTMRKKSLALSACLLIVGGLLSGCGGDDAAGQSSPPTATGTVIDATIRGDQVTPNGERLKVKKGEEITINVDADREGELHVHSSPEQELEYNKGKTTLHVTIDTPGIVEIEDHVADKVLVSLEVS